MPNVDALRTEYEALRAYTEQSSDARYVEDITVEVDGVDLTESRRRELGAINYQPGVQVYDILDEMRAVVEWADERQARGATGPVLAEPFAQQMVQLGSAARAEVQDRRHRVDRIVDEILDPATSSARENELRDQLAALPFNMLILKIDDAGASNLTIEGGLSPRAEVLKQAFFENTGATRAEAIDLNRLSEDGFIVPRCSGDRLNVFVFGPLRVNVDEGYLRQLQPRVRAAVEDALR